MNKKLLDKANQLMIVVDSKGKATGEIVSRKEAHKSPGIKHLAIQILLFNDKKQLILHKRQKNKIDNGVFDTPATHILKGETRNQAAWRALRDEYSISKEISLNWFASFSYKKDYKDGTCENEFGFASIAVFNGKLFPNIKEIEGQLIFKSANGVLTDLENFPTKYPIWFQNAIRFLKKSKSGKDFFNH